MSLLNCIPNCLCQRWAMKVLVSHNFNWVNSVSSGNCLSSFASLMLWSFLSAQGDQFIPAVFAFPWNPDFSHHHYEVGPHMLLLIRAFLFLVHVWQLFYYSDFSHCHYLVDPKWYHLIVPLNISDLNSHFSFFIFPSSSPKVSHLPALSIYVCSNIYYYSATSREEVDSCLSQGD